jgi:hypothetical protein
MVIIDANTLSHVFNPKDARHVDFKPLFDFIKSRRKILAWGGTTYNNELKNSPKYLGVLIELENIGISRKFPDEPIDSYEAYLYSIINHPDFDDAHIISLQVSSKAKIICSLDKRSYPYIKDQIDGIKLYPKRHRRPSIYSKRSNQNLLSRL